MGHLRVRRMILCAVFVFSCVTQSRASAFGDVRGIVFDPQHHAIARASIRLHSRSSDFSQTMQSNASGEFLFRAIPIGEYTLTIESVGFNSLEQPVTVISSNAPVLHFYLAIAPVSQHVEVVASDATTGTDSPTPTTLVSREEISRAPGASRTNSLAFITNYVPGSYVTHNQLHVRGGHQVTWLIDGVPVPNTNIADTVGAQFDPKDIDYLEVQRGSYSSEFGDRTYGVFNVVPRSGFERNHEAQLLLSFGNFSQTNDQLGFAGHTKRFAYYTSLNGNRSDYGLATPTASVLHDRSNGFGGFASLIFNPNTRNQLRLATNVRRDFFQAPNDRDAQDLGIRDVQRETDAFVNFTWAHTFDSKLLLTMSPFYHFNRADFVGGPDDVPVSARDRRGSQYAGAQATMSLLTHRHNARIGFFGFYQRDSDLFALRGVTAGAPIDLSQTQNLNGNLEAVFAEDQFKLTSWLTLTGGVRFTRFQGALNENATSPRVGASVRIPHLNWVLHGFYGRYYQAPPLSTIAGPLLQLAISQGFDFIPLRGERDAEYQFGLSIPVRGWTIGSDYSRTTARNFFDHEALANSNIFFPLTIDRARIRAFEATARSPMLFRRGQFHLAYSHQKIEGAGAVTGGLTDFSPPVGFFLLDHDQRNTLSTGFSVNLPGSSYLSTNVRYGSGFLDGDHSLNHLPGHMLVDLSFGKNFSEQWLLAIQVVNTANQRFLLDNSNTFGGTHFVEPRQIYLELRYRFHY